MSEESIEKRTVVAFLQKTWLGMLVCQNAKQRLPFVSPTQLNYYPAVLEFLRGSKMPDHYDLENINVSQNVGREKLRLVISENTRKRRIKILITSAFAIALAVTEKLPAKIPLVDIALDADYGRVFLACLLFFNFVLLITFLTGAHPDREILRNTADDLRERLAYEKRQHFQKIEINSLSVDSIDLEKAATKGFGRMEERLELAIKVSNYRSFLELWLPAIIGLFGASLLIKLVLP
jgi:hypothetical protein